MKKFLQLFAFLFLVSSLGFAQTTILDFEAPETSTVFQYFGSSLDEMTTTVVANPDASGINTSANVGEYIKAAGALEWAGAFSNPNPTTAIDLTSNTQLCVKVWFPEAGDLLIKLEEGTADNWEQSVAVDQTNTWVEVCANTAETSGNGDPVIAAGNTYNKLVLFFGFDVVQGVEDAIYYFDDVTTQEGEVIVEDVTFSVNISEVDNLPASPTVSVFGSFNNWDSTANPMSDDGDGVWSVTLPLNVGSYEYKYFITGGDGSTLEESFTPGASCTMTTDEFTNRTLVVTQSTVLDPVCWESCFGCGEGISITINLGTSHITPSPDGVYLAGGGTFGNPGDNLMTDDDGDGVYTITFTQPAGFSSFYTFTNGNCPDYSCKENISGQDCANPDNFNDRFMGPITQDTVINTCFALCTIDTECGDLPGTGMVTFSVNTNDFGTAPTVVELAGSFNNWNAASNPMTDDNSDGVWEATLELVDGVYEYKFVTDGAFEELEEGSSCTITSSGFTNRLLTVAGDATLGVVCYGSCADCSTNLDELAVLGIDFQVSPTVANERVQLSFGKQLPLNSRLNVVNINGQIVEQTTLNQVENYNLDVSHLSAGMYFLQLQFEDAISVRRMVKQ